MIPPLNPLKNNNPYNGTTLENIFSQQLDKIEKLHTIMSTGNKVETANSDIHESEWDE